MDRQLAAAVIATFRDRDALHHRTQLQGFSARRWVANFHWLDASGLALYFLQRLKSLDIEDAVPQSVLRQLEERHADNRLRTASLFDEFARINATFRKAGLDYVNLKGFTLAPDYSPDLSLRYQLDCDFLISRRDRLHCGEILGVLGYSLVVANSHVMEFKTQAAGTPRMDDLYRPRTQRSVEVHLCDETTADSPPPLLRRARNLEISGGFYPALSHEDMFLWQARHLFRHLRSEWTRVCWFLEFRRFVEKRREDAAFWRAARLLATEENQDAAAIGVAVRVTQKGFGEFAPPELTTWTADRLPRDVAKWIERYGETVVLADFPGSKLYLLLERALDGKKSSSLVRHRLFPTRGPAPVLPSASGRKVRRLRAACTRWSYFFFRFRFHCTANLRYFVESWRWNRLRAPHATADPCPSADCVANSAD